MACVAKNFQKPLDLIIIIKKPYKIPFKTVKDFFFWGRSLSKKCSHTSRSPDPPFRAQNPQSFLLQCNYHSVKLFLWSLSSYKNNKPFFFPHKAKKSKGRKRHDRSSAELDRYLWQQTMSGNGGCSFSARENQQNFVCNDRFAHLFEATELSQLHPWDGQKKSWRSSWKPP